LAVSGDGRLRVYEQPLSFIPFSTYNLGTLPPQALALHYVPPKRKTGDPQRLQPLPPRGLTLVAHAIRRPGQRLEVRAKGQNAFTPLPDAPTLGRLLRIAGPVAECEIRAT
jgi:hypothetical protein